MENIKEGLVNGDFVLLNVQVCVIKIFISSISSNGFSGSGNSNAVVVRIVFGRDFLNDLLTTFLPGILIVLVYS